MVASAIGYDSPSAFVYSFRKEFGVTPYPFLSTHGAFKTPSLRNVALTAPYMHTGQFKDLESVVDFYDRAGDNKEGKSRFIKKLGLSPANSKIHAAKLVVVVLPCVPVTAIT